MLNLKDEDLKKKNQLLFQERPPRGLEDPGFHFRDKEAEACTHALSFPCEWPVTGQKLELRGEKTPDGWGDHSAYPACVVCLSPGPWLWTGWSIGWGPHCLVQLGRELERALRQAQEGAEIASADGVHTIEKH